jgi:hypothetical protein
MSKAKYIIDSIDNSRSSTMGRAKDILVKFGDHSLFNEDMVRPSDFSASLGKNTDIPSLHKAEVIRVYNKFIGKPDFTVDKFKKELSDDTHLTSSEITQALSALSAAKNK